MFNILSIDIDYAYSPSIAQYDDLIEGTRISIEEQMEILKQQNLRPKVNHEKLAEIKRVLRTKTSSDTPIVIAENHHQILRFIPECSFCIYNFDHHHDIFYPGWHQRHIVDEGNWVSHCEKLVDYYWIRNKDSEDIDPSVQFNCIEILNSQEFDYPQFDLVFACFSPHWTGAQGKKNLLSLLL